MQKEKSPKIIPDSIIPDVWEKHLAGQSRTRPISPHCLLNPHQAGKHPDEKERYISLDIRSVFFRYIFKRNEKKHLNPHAQMNKKYMYIYIILPMYDKTLVLVIC